MTQISLGQTDPGVLVKPAVKPTDSPQKIKDAAQQFESLLISQILETAHDDGGWLGSGGDSSGGAAMSFAEQQLAGAIAHQGGLGLAAIISTGLEQRSAAASVPNAALPSPP